VSPEQRHVRMVFKGYALFPHLTVAENVSARLEEQCRQLSDAEQLIALAAPD